MAVEARHMNLFPQQIITNRDFVNVDQANAYGYNSGQMGYGVPFTTTMAENFLPFNQSLVGDSVQPKTSMKAESGLTYNLPIAPRKRPRDSVNNQLDSVMIPQKSNFPHDFSSVLGEESLSLQIHQHQLEIDHIISQYTKKIRLEVEERQKQQARLLVSAIGEGVINKLKEKDDQIQKMGKLNLALQERVKNLYLENQLLKDIAQSNEATALSLRSNLEQVLAHLSKERQIPAGGLTEEAESCCGSSGCGRDKEDADVVGQRRTLASEEFDGVRNRMCRKCGERESCVLLLPCRHLCICTICGTTLQSTCPVCNSSMNATVHVSMY